MARAEVNRVSVIGTGYLGATHAACLAELGFEVVGVDRDAARMASLARGRVPFHEPGLDELLGRHVRSGRLRFTTSLADASAHADVHFLCVGTPQGPVGGAADLGALTEVTQALGALLPRDSVVIGKSTVPVGTAEQLAALLSKATRPGVEALVAWNPEFLREGHAVQDSLEPDRLVFGVDDHRAEEVLRSIYARPLAGGCPLHVTDLATAELAKVAANCFLATKISFVNAMAEVCELSGADIVSLADVLGDDPRIGRRFLDAGVGFGGGCLPKDLRAFAARAEELGGSAAARLMHHVDDINLAARQRIVDQAIHLLGPRRKGQRVAVLGAAFKPLSDDVRDSPALAVAQQLQLHGADVRVHDPMALRNARLAAPELSYSEDPEEALDGAHLVLHLTDWPQFRDIDPTQAGRLARNLRLIDGRNSLCHDRWRQAGWRVFGVGRPAHDVRSRRTRVR